MLSSCKYNYDLNKDMSKERKVRKVEEKMMIFRETKTLRCRGTANAGALTLIILIVLFTLKISNGRELRESFSGGRLLCFKSDSIDVKII